MKAARFSAKGGNIELVSDAPIPEPAPSQVLIKVEACGICHTDSLVQAGVVPGQAYPRIPGHEVVGRIEKLGEGVVGYSVGDRVGVGYHGYHCEQCDSCRNGDYMVCKEFKATGIWFDGGWAEYTVAYARVLARVPDELPSEEAGPLMCAGVTCYNSMRNSTARAGDLVAIQGIGGLGHLAVQYGKKLGYRVAAISGGTNKKELALELGAHHYIDYNVSDPATELQRLGGAKLIVCTASDSKSISALVNGLGPNGQLLVLSAGTDPILVYPFQLISMRRAIYGWPAGTGKDSEDTLRFSQLTGVKPYVQTFPLDDIQKAYDLMMSNKARFRAVVVMENKQPK